MILVRVIIREMKKYLSFPCKYQRWYPTSRLALGQLHAYVWQNPFMVKDVQTVHWKCYVHFLSCKKKKENTIFELQRLYKSKNIVWRLQGIIIWEEVLFDYKFVIRIFWCKINNTCILKRHYVYVNIMSCNYKSYNGCH